LIFIFGHNTWFSSEVGVQGFKFKVQGWLSNFEP
jgi:hypothetical protein